MPWSSGDRVTSDALNHRGGAAVQAKDPKYALTGDGASDDGTTAETTLLPDGNDGTVFFSDGTYRTAINVDLPSNANIELVGANADRVVFNGASGTAWFRALAATSPKRVVIRNVTFDGEHVRGTWPFFGVDTQVGMNGLNLVADPDDNDTEVILERCTFKDVQALPFVITGFRRATVTNCRIIRSGGLGFVNCENVVFTNNTVEFCHDYAVTVSSYCKRVVVTGNVMRECKFGVGIQGDNVGTKLGPENVTISGNVITGTSSSAIRATGGIKNVAITGNVIERAGYAVQPFGSSGFSRMGDAVSGSTFLSVSGSTSTLAADQYVFVENREQENTRSFVGKIDSVRTVGVALTASAPFSITTARISFIEQDETQAIFVTGRVNPTTFVDHYAEKISITGNVIANPSQYGIQLGSATGAVQDAVVAGNVINFVDAYPREVTAVGVRIEDVTDNGNGDAVHNRRISITGNQLGFDGTGTGIDHVPSTVTTVNVVRVADNQITNASTNLSIDTEYYPSFIDDDNVEDFRRIATVELQTLRASIEARSLPETSEAAMVSTSGDSLTIATTFSTVSAGNSSATVLGFNYTGGTRPVFWIRNGSANTAEIKNNTNIRTNTGADLALTQHQVAGFYAVSDTIVQQLF